MPANAIAVATPLWVRAAAVVAAATDNSTALDMTGYEGVATFVWVTGAITGTMDAKLQDSADNSSFADVTGATASQVTTANQIRSISVDVRNVRRYVRAVSVVATTSCALGVSAIVQKKVTG